MTYQTCPQCQARMIRVGESDETYGESAAPKNAYYACPNCRHMLTHHRDINATANRHSGARVRQPRLIWGAQKRRNAAGESAGLRCRS